MFNSKLLKRNQNLRLSTRRKISFQIVTCVLEIGNCEQSVLISWHVFENEPRNLNKLFVAFNFMTRLSRFRELIFFVHKPR